MARVFVEPANINYNNNKGKFFKAVNGNELNDIKELKKVVKKLMKMNFRLMEMIEKNG